MSPPPEGFLAPLDGAWDLHSFLLASSPPLQSWVPCEEELGSDILVLYHAARCLAHNGLQWVLDLRRKNSTAPFMPIRVWFCSRLKIPWVPKRSYLSHGHAITNLKLSVPNLDSWHLPAGPVWAPGNSTLLVNHDPLVEICNSSIMSNFLNIFSPWC